MATKYWNATGANVDWSTAGNWDPSGVPEANDIVIFDGRSQNSVTAGLGQGSIDLQALTVTEGYTGNIGDDSTALTIAVSNATTSSPVFTYAGRGTCKITAGTNGIDVASIDRTGGGSLILSGGTFVELRVSSGTVSQIAAAVVTTANVYSGQLSAAAGTVYTTLNVHGGVVTSSRGATTTNARGGRTRFLAAAVPATVNLQSNAARVEHWSTGTITNLNVFAGTWTPVGNPSAGFTVTNSLRNPGGTLVEEYAGGTVTFTNPTVAPGKDSPGI